MTEISIAYIILGNMRKIAINQDENNGNRKPGQEIKLNTPFVRTKIINGNSYLYEITPYWDYQTGKQRQKSKYLGRAKQPITSVETGTIPSPSSSSVSDTTTPHSTIPTNASLSSVKHQVDFGDAYLFHTLVTELKLDSLLKQCFPEEEAHFILLAAGYRLLSGKSFSMMESFVESSELSNLYPVSFSLSSPAISNHFAALGKDQEGAIYHFFLRWAQQFQMTEDNWLFDLTSFSSQAEEIAYLEYGHAKQKEWLPQINMGLLVNQTRRLPLYYKLYPGSIKDVSTLVNLITETKLLSIPTMKLVLDRGFYSQSNLAALQEACIDFIIPLPRSSQKLTQQIIQKHQDDLPLSKNLYQVGDRLLHCVQGTLESGLYYSLYLDSDQQQKEHLHFLFELLQAEKTLFIALSPPPWETHSFLSKKKNRSEQWRDLAKGWSQYLDPVWDIDKKAYRIERNEQAIQQEKAETGLSIWLHSQRMLPTEVLPMYRERDAVEKLFDACKNELVGLPLRVHKTDTMQGLFFILFISLILQYHLLEKMKQGQVDPKYSIARIFFELRKLKKAIWFGQHQLIDEITKTQRELFKQLNVLLPKSCWN